MHPFAARLYQLFHQTPPAPPAIFEMRATNARLNLVWTNPETPLTRPDVDMPRTEWESHTHNIGMHEGPSGMLAARIYDAGHAEPVVSVFFDDAGRATHVIVQSAKDITVTTECMDVADTRPVAAAP